MSAMGWVISDDDLQTLKKKYPPTYAFLAVPHCTLELGSSRQSRLPPPRKGVVFGKIDNLDGVEALLLSIDGETVRPDGAVLHITWSLGPGRRPRDSHEAIRTTAPLLSESPIEVHLIPSRF
ncbi:hypothetical protein Saro_3949 (plasmid) [Novosphingobium aromaticivorans DSM 12444]|uniref:Uncharacterized protein n=1 Tax=Novosphingobium aromaticivorans (strain ATCC 700278 / DSM 12444 / CCUG 56034 / CIP 105152 / NBRC 16084 / F199) TaxID=279238 RepID=A4XE30_NOVAD|nr:hypothetical protein Saro_3949 [Novosphingobium aromaticivorans DSM 12444]